MALTKFPINNFRGGLNTRDNPFELTPNESPDLLNVTITSLVGTLRTREGKSSGQFPEALPNEKVDHMKQCIIGVNKRFLLLSINGNVWSCDEGGKLVKRHAGTAGTIWDFEVFADANYKDWVWMLNGVDAPQKWDGEAAESVAWTATKGAIPNGNVLTMWENRLIISGESAKPQRLFFSEFSDPEATLKEYGFVDVRATEDDLDAVQDIAVLGARLFVLKRRSVFFVSSPVTFLNRRIGGPGVYSRFQVAEMEDKLYWFNPQGIWGTGGVSVTMESGSINTYFPNNLNQTEAQLKGARLIVTRDTYPRLLLAVATGAATRNNMLIEMIPHINFRRIGGRRYLLLPAFMLHTIPADALAAWNPKGVEEQLIAASPQEGSTGSPEGPIIDSFIRANEKPLSNAGKWKPDGAAGRMGEIFNNRWTPEHGGSTNAGAYWTTEQNNPAISVQITQACRISFPPIHLCVSKNVGDPNEPTNTGYDVEYNPGKTNKDQIQLVRKVLGVYTTLAETHVHIADNGSLGLTVRNGKVSVWVKTISGEPWTKVLEVTDSTLTKGFVSFRAQQVLKEGEETGLETLLNNFAMGETGVGPETLYRIFHGTTDDGQPILAHWRSAWFPLQEGESRERVRRLDVQLSGDALLDVYTDFEEAPRFSSPLPKSGELGEFDEPVAEGLAYRFARVRPETYGRYHSIKLSTDLEGNPFIVNTAELVYRGGKQH